MTRTTSTSFWVLLRVVKYAGVPHFLTETHQTSFEVLEAKRFPSLRAAADAATALGRSAGWCVPKHISLTTTYTLSDTPT